MAPSKKYVALAEVVKKWNRSEDEIICWANDCEFFLCSSQTLLQRDGSRYIGWVIIPPAALGGYLSGKNSIACSRFFRMGDQPPYSLQTALRMLKEKVRGDLVNCSEQIYHLGPSISAEEMKKAHPDLDLDQMPDISALLEEEITIDRTSLHIHKDEIASMEKRYPELKPASACTDLATLAGDVVSPPGGDQKKPADGAAIKVSGKLLKSKEEFREYLGLSIGKLEDLLQRYPFQDGAGICGKVGGGWLIYTSQADQWLAWVQIQESQHAGTTSSP